MATGTRLDEPIADSAIWRPPAALRPFVDSYVGYRYLGWEPGTHLGLPSRHLTFILSFDEPLRVTMPGERAPIDFDVMVSGFHTSPAVITHDGDQHGVQLQMTPAGCRALLGAPPSAIARVCIDLRELWSAPVVDRMYAEAASATGWAERFAAVDRALLAALAQALPHASAERVATDAWGLLTSGATTTVQGLATELGWSRRHLTARFAEEYGVTPKAMARVVRFERSRWLVGRVDRPTLADIAAWCGYADQAHMTREWNDLAGCSPTAWLAAEQLPIVQDDLASGGAG